MRWRMSDIKSIIDFFFDSLIAKIKKKNTNSLLAIHDYIEQWNQKIVIIATEGSDATISTSFKDCLKNQDRAQFYLDNLHAAINANAEVKYRMIFIHAIMKYDFLKSALTPEIVEKEFGFTKKQFSRYKFGSKEADYYEDQIITAYKMIVGEKPVDSI